ncbi:hypothetical protein [Rhodococcus koreensis]
MFSGNTIRDIDVDANAVYVGALVDKLVDIDKTRIHSTDSLVLRKAVFGLLEIVGNLERRIAELEGPGVSAAWADRVDRELGRPTPDEQRLGEGR